MTVYAQTTLILPFPSDTHLAYTSGPLLHTHAGLPHPSFCFSLPVGLLCWLSSSAVFMKLPKKLNLHFGFFWHAILFSQQQVSRMWRRLLVNDIAGSNDRNQCGTEWWMNAKKFLNAWLLICLGGWVKSMCGRETLHSMSCWAIDFLYYTVGLYEIHFNFSNIPFYSFEFFWILGFTI